MWKLSPKILFLFLTCTMLSDCLSGAKLKCSFQSGNLGYLKSTNPYYCQVVDDAIYDSSRVTIDGVETPHLSGKSNDNVHAIYFYSITKLTYFPRNIENVFKNLKGIFVYNSNLQEISQDDLRPFPKLEEIFLPSNKITSLEANLFKFNPNLKYVRLYSNQISHIDPNVFDHLNNLEKLEFSGNNCKSQLSNAYNRSDVLKFVERIKNGDCTSPEKMQKKKEAEDQVIKNITTLQAENEEFSTKLSEMKINLTSAINEKSTLKENLNDLRDQHEKLHSKHIEAEKSNQQLTSEHMSCEKSKNDSNSELQAKYENVKESLQESKKMNDELSKKNQALMENSDQLKDKLLMSKDKILNMVEQMNEMRVKYESLLQTKLAQSEKLVEKLIEKKTIANDDEEEVEKKDGNSDCLTLYFGPQQRPIILTN